MMGGQSITGRMVLIWLLAFFGTIFAVNAVLVFFALSSWPGLTTDKAYEEGIAYNRTLDA
ncbi:MAG: nitrogen fixation protein FixH, partial [Alphaproteobacteria bacterium]|nr:nitrogen fixation protein FixH [Alphaproteobacteria bacterium]